MFAHRNDFTISCSTKDTHVKQRVPIYLVFLPYITRTEIDCYMDGMLVELCKLAEPYWLSYVDIEVMVKDMIY